jgi:ribonuclease R
LSTPARTPQRAGRGRPPSQPVVSVLGKQGRLMVAEPLFDRDARRLSIAGKAAGGAKVGDLVLVGSGKRGARVIRSLGRPDVPRDVLEGLMIDRGLWRTFSRAVELEAEEAAEAVQARVRDGRKDLTELPTFTIDPATAKDFDDAISAQREGDAIRVWVHIADVSAFVRPGSTIEAEAYRRGTSVYVPGAVEPMLPEALSNQACSLVPGEERLAVTVEMELVGVNVRSVSFHRSLIRSDARLTYDDVDRVFAGEEPAREPWAEPLAAARDVAKALREQREERGSLAVESSEQQFEFDENGYVVGVHHETQTESHSLIEQLMILANEQVAGYLADRAAPALYRVHERPAPQSVEWLATQLASLEVPTPPVPKQMSPQQAGELAGEISQMVADHVRRTGRGRAALTSLVLRSLKQAYYSPKNLGHAGLASARYCHFTSPIRRYPDLVVHRALLGSLGLDDAAPRAEELEEAALDSSAAERHAMQIERDAADVCRCFLLERRLAEAGEEIEFHGEVVGLISAGAFISFGEEGFEGMLPVRRMRDYWELNEESTMLVGRRSGDVLRLGDPIAVKVDRVDSPRGRVDLTPAA